MSARYNMDDPSDVARLQAKLSQSPDVPQIHARRTRYGTPAALGLGLEPVEAVPDVLIPRDAYKDVLASCHAQRSLPLYHMWDSWCKPGVKYNQANLPYCWAWSGAACLMTTRAAELKPTVTLAPVSMGYLVGWRSAGNYLESFIEGARDKGICPGDLNDRRNSASAWSSLESERAKYRLRAVWDTNPKAGDATMIQHCLSILAYGRPLYCAWYHLSHAMATVGLRWDESVTNNLVWIIRNSHNESDVIEMTGSNAIPDEAFGFASTEVME